MGSLLGSIFGEGSPTQGDTFTDRLRAQYAPGAYQAHQTNMQQQAIYSAMLQNGASPEQAQAMAVSPQAYAAQQGAYNAQAPQVMPVQNNDGSQTLVDIRNPGGNAGHGHSLSGIPITAPGTTTSPTQAAGGDRGAQAPQGAEQSGNAPAASAGPTNTLQGMPGSTNATVEAIGKAREAGVDPYSLIPPAQRAVTKAIVDGKMTLSEIKQTRGEHIAGTVRNYVLAIDPDYNELKGEKSANYVKSYMDTKTGDVGMSRNALGTSLGHISDAIDNQIDLKNHDANMNLLGQADNRIRGAFGEQSNKVAKQNLQIGTAADELAKFITGKPPTDASRGQYREAFPTPFDTPRVAAAKYTAMADLLEKRMTDMESERDANFSGKDVAKDYPIVLPQHRELIANIRKKAAQLAGAGEYQIEHGQGQEASAAPERGLPPGWKLVK